MTTPPISSGIWAGHPKPRITAVLINLPSPDIEDDRRQPPGGLVSIATYVHRNGFPVAVCDLAGMAGKDLVRLVPAADVYGFSTYSTSYKIAQEIVKRLRKRSPSAVCVAGGPHASALPEEVARDFDCAVCGEGEEAFLGILRRVQQGEADHIPQIIRACPIEDLDALPLPDFERFSDMAGYTRRLNGSPVMSLDSSRGCNHRCRFCNSRVVERGHWRGRSPENVAGEVESHVKRGWEAFRFNDDNFCDDVGRALAICDLLRPMHIRFRIFARAESLSSVELCRRLAAAGCVHVAVGIESLSPLVLARMGKATQVDRIKSGLATARAAGLLTRGFFIVGFPGETDATVAESIAALRGIALDEAVAYPCIPYPGTDLFALPDRYGITWIDPDFSHYIQVGRGKSAGFVMKTETFGPAEVRRWRQQYMQALEELGIAWSDQRKAVV